jgi:hypothetical protein
MYLFVSYFSNAVKHHLKKTIYQWPPKVDFPTLFSELNEIMEGKDEGFVPWVMGWIHSATNFVAADEN